MPLQRHRGTGMRVGAGHNVHDGADVPFESVRMPLDVKLAVLIRFRALLPFPVVRE